MTQPNGLTLSTLARLAALALPAAAATLLSLPVQAQPEAIPGRGGAPARVSQPIGAVRQGLLGKVVSVSDGNTLTVLVEFPSVGGKKTPVKVRLHGVDCPKKGQPFSQSAREFTRRKVYGKQVTVKVTDKDRYGHTVGVVLTEDLQDLNQALVKSGLAWWFRKYAPGDTRLRALEAEARAARRGIWSQKNPTPPWEFRRSPSSSGRPRAPSARPARSMVAPVAATVCARRTGTWSAGRSRG